MSGAVGCFAGFRITPVDRSYRVGMELTGSRFAFEVPAGWAPEARGDDGEVGAASNESLTGFTPNALLREWQVKHSYRGLLALASQRSFRELAKQHTILHVEAIPDENAPSNIGERRRLWAFSTRETPGASEDLLSLLTIRDLLVTEEALAELTVTVPLTTWRRGDAHEAILNSLRPHRRNRLDALLRGGNRAPGTVMDTGEQTVIDEWATRRDHATRESLGLPETTTSVPGQDTPFPSNPFKPGFFEEVAELSEKAFKAFSDLALLGCLKKSARWSSAGRELVRAGLIDRKGIATAQGERLIRHLRNGRHMALLVDSAPQLLLTFWIHGLDALVVMSFVALGTRALAFCPVKRIPQLLLSLISFYPSWDMNFSYTLTRNEFLAKLLSNVPPRAATGKDAIAFSEQRWVPLSLLGPDESPELAWVMAPNRGVAILKDNGDAKEITLTSDPNEPFWELLLETSTRLAEEQHP